MTIDTSMRAPGERGSAPAPIPEPALAPASFLGRELPSDDVCYRVLATHDARFDGLFFVGVKSTGIYCRAVCTAKLPRRENCTFYKTAAAAEAAGYRPCLKCRPELAPGEPLAPDLDAAVQRAATAIREHPDARSLSQVAADQGVSDRHLRRLFEGHFGVTPAAYRDTCRLLLAKSLLTDTDLPITRVAYASGFSSTRRFNDAFLKAYRLQPRRFRKEAAPGVGPRTADRPIVLHVGYRAPYRFDLLIGFLALRAIEGVETVEGGVYHRIVRTADPARPGWISVADEPKRSRLAVTLSPELFGEIPSVLARVRRLFDTDCVPGAVEEGLADFYARVPEGNRIPGVRVPCSFDGFEMAVRAVLGQQITVKAASTLAGRVARAFGSPAAGPVSALTTAFPAPEAFCAPDAPERLGELGVIGQRARAICAIAEKLVQGRITLRPGADTQAEAAELGAIRGIGDWTVQYLLMRAYDFPDAFLPADYGVKCALPGLKPRELARLSEPWRPWRSYAVMSLWCGPHS